MRARAVSELVIAAAALVGAVLSWLAAGRSVVVAPVLEGEPPTTSIEYSAPYVGLALMLLTVAGVLAVLGVARLRRVRRAGEHAAK